jgi:nitrate reductase NapE component
MSETPTASRPSAKQLLKILGIIVAVCLFPILVVFCVFAFAP